MNDLIPGELGSGALVDLAKAIGILNQDGSFNGDWFNDPAAEMADLFTSADTNDHARRQSLLQALSQLFDQGGSSLQDDTWSLALGDSGLDLLIRSSESGEGDEIEIGIGGRWTLLDNEPKVELEAQFGVLGVDLDKSSDQLRVAKGIDASFELSQFGGPADILDGVAVGVHIPFWETEDTVVTVSLTGIGEDDEDNTFTFDTSPDWDEDFKDPVLRLLLLGVILAVSQIRAREGASTGEIEAAAHAKAALENLLSLLGWKDPGAGYPVLELDGLFSDPARAAQTWLQAVWAAADDDAGPPISSDSNNVNRFLKRLLGVSRLDQELTVEQDGDIIVVRPTALDQFRFELLLWAEPDSTGAERLHLGLRISANEELGAAGPRLTFEAVADIVSFPLSGPISVAAVGEFCVDLRLGPRTGADHAITLSAGDLTDELAFLGALNIGELVAGLKLDITGKCEPMVELRELSLTTKPDNRELSWPVLDLTDGGAVVEAGEALAVGAVVGAIRAKLGESEAGKCFAILLGIDRPDGPANADYPQLDAAALVDRPVDAYERFMAELIADPAPQWFKVWLDTLLQLLNLAGLGAPAIAGSGTTAEPWRLIMSSGSAGAVAFEFHVRPGAGSERTLGVDLAANPPLLALGSFARLEARAVAGLLRLAVDDPAATDPAITVTPVPGAWVDAALIPPTDGASAVISVDAGLALLQAKRLVAGVDWERGQDPIPAVDLVDPAIVLDLTGADGGTTRLDLGDLAGALSLPAGALPSLRLEGFGGLSGFGIGAFDGTGISLPGVSLPNFGALDFSAPDLGLGSGGQWLVEIGNLTLNLLALGLPSWALGGSEGAWRSWSLGMIQLLGGWPNFTLGSAGSTDITWPEAGFDFDLTALIRFVKNPFNGLLMRLGQLFTLDGSGPTVNAGGPAGMALLWRWLHAELPDLDGSLATPATPEITGEGTYEDPWAIRINEPSPSTDPSDREFPVELLVWLDPDGPPAVDGAGTPTHLGFGLRLDLAPEAIPESDYELDFYARADLFTVDISEVTGASGAARPTPALQLEAVMQHKDRNDSSDTVGWLLNQESSAIKLRAVEFGLLWRPTHADASQQIVPRFELVDAGYQEGIDAPVTTGDLVGLTALSVGGVLLDRLADPGMPLADPSMRPLMVALEVLGVATEESDGSFRFLAAPMQRLLTEPQVYLPERFWDSTHDVPRLRPLAPAFDEIGFESGETEGVWWVEAPLGPRVIRLEQDGTLRVTLDETFGGEVDFDLELMFNPFSGRTEGVFAIGVGGADLELQASWQDLDGYGGTEGSFSLALVPSPDSDPLTLTDMEEVFEGPLVLWPVADASALGQRVLKIGYRLALDFALGTLYTGLIAPELSTQAESNLLAFGIIEGTPGDTRPAPLWALFDDPLGKILARLGSLEGTYPVGDDFEIFADGVRLQLRTTGGNPIAIGSSGVELGAALGVLTASWEPALALGLSYPIPVADGTATVSVEAGYEGSQASLTICGLQILPNFGGFTGQLDVDNMIRAILPAALTGAIVGLSSSPDTSAIATALSTLMGASSSSVSDRYAAVSSYIGDLIDFIDTPNIDFFTDDRVRDLLTALEAVLALLPSQVSTTRLGAAHDDYDDADGPPPSDSNGTRTRVAIDGIPLAIVIGKREESGMPRVGIWLVRNGALDFGGYVTIAETSRLGAYISGTGTTIIPGAECTLGVGGDIPAPVNLQPVLSLDLDTLGSDPSGPEVAILTIYLVGGDTEETGDDVSIQILPEFDATFNNPGKLLGESVLPTLAALAELAGLTEEKLNEPLLGPLTVLHVIIGSAGLLATAGAVTWLLLDPDADDFILGHLFGSFDTIDSGLAGAIGHDLLYSEPGTTGGVSWKRYGVQIPTSLSGLIPKLADDPQISILLGTEADLPRIPLVYVPFTSEGSPDIEGIRFEPGFWLRDIGLRIAGSGGGPLLSEVIGIGAVVATFDFDIGPEEWTAESIRYGFGVGIEGLALPFGSANGGDGDPVAQSLMSDGGDNPGIDIYVSWSNRDPAGFELQFPQASNPAGGKLELPLDMQFGPLELAALTVATVGGLVAHAASNPVDFTFDGSFGLGPLNVEVDDFGLSIPLGSIGDPSTWSVTLSGLAVSFDQPPVQISAALLKQVGEYRETPSSPPQMLTEYVGTASVRVAGFELAAIGAYSKIPPAHPGGDSDASLFIFAMVPVPLGGPPAFFVEGIAGGFGYNRGFTTPQIHEVASHPLMVALKGSDTPLLDTLRSVQTVLPAKRGAYWFAAGVKFSSFVFIKGSALLYILFDQGFELGLLGHASLKLPDADACVLSIGLVLSVGFTTRGDQGPMLWAEAQLTEDSWVLHSSIQLTGGFALRVWFDTGETVLSLGGYHPAFKPPDNYSYPVVPRIGLRWSVSSYVTIKGECYFAITPREAMTGGGLEATGKFGPVKAWFRLGVDILIGWDPFYYDFRMHIEIGFEVDLWLFTLRASVGVRLEIRGPELSGKATIDLSLVTFTVRFGAKADPTKKPISVEEFAENHLQLPQLSSSTPINATKHTDGRSPFDFTVTRGVVPSDETPTPDDKPSDDDGIIDIDPEATFLVRTRMPFNANADKSSDPEDPDYWAGPRIDLLPAAKLNVHSKINVDVTAANDGDLDFFAESTHLPKAMFLGASDDNEGDEEARMRPNSEGGSTTSMPDHLRIVAAPTLRPSNPKKLDAYGKERAEYDHRLPLGESPAWSGSLEAKRDSLTTTIGDGVEGIQRMSGARKAGIAELATGVDASSYLSAILAPSAALEANKDLVTPARDSGGSSGTGVVATWLWEARLEAIGVIMPALSKLEGASALTKTSVRGVRSAARSAKVKAPSVVERREVDLIGIRLKTVSSRNATQAAGAGRTIYRKGRITQQAVNALDTLTKRVTGKVRGDAVVAAGVTQVYDVPKDGVPPAKHGGSNMRMRVQGNQVGRLLFLGLGGRVLSDEEFGPGTHTIQLPPGTKRVVTAGLGTPTAFRRAKATEKSPTKRPSKAEAVEAARRRAAERLAAQRRAEKLAAQKRAAAEKLAAQRAAEKLAAQRAAEKLAAQRAAEKLATQQRAAQQRAAAKRAAQQRAAARRAAQQRAAAKRAAQQRAAQQRAAANQTTSRTAVKQPSQTTSRRTSNQTRLISKQPSLRPMGGLSSAQLANLAGRRPGGKLESGRLGRSGTATVATKPTTAVLIGQPIAMQPVLNVDPRIIAEAMRGRVIENLPAPMQPIDLRLPRGRGQARFTSLYARRDVATVGFDEGSRLVRVGARVYLARGSTVEILEGPPRSRALQADLARDVLGRARSIRVSMPASASTLIVICTGSVSGSVPVAQAVKVRALGARLNRPKLVVIPGQGALVRQVTTNKDYQVEVEVPRGFRIVAVVGGPGNVDEWTARLASLDEWDLVEDGPLAPKGSTKLRLEVSK